MPPPPWAIAAPVRHLGCLRIDMLSVTWNRFQEEVIRYIGRGDDQALVRVLRGANERGELQWQAMLSGDPHYTPGNKITIRGDSDFKCFGVAAYELFPNKVLVKLVMRDPSDETPAGVIADPVKRPRGVGPSDVVRPPNGIPCAPPSEKENNSGNGGMAARAITDDGSNRAKKKNKLNGPGELGPVAAAHTANLAGIGATGSASDKFSKGRGKG
ncbi:hypothetical protein PtA15_16A142 [Puccinia triticina]|uniref:Uncharacterized protein n=1 Tax=Puccinia triticina TaxID=208348 RepID=A0ABY7D4A5_9BASI|nr:uncharacterized protein PtA15_16A142 [Puccinia triticina]WAQ92236.1 hypothetical protein PtA15_16A142 [Puccinia triticina]